MEPTIDIRRIAEPAINRINRLSIIFKAASVRSDDPLRRVPAGRTSRPKQKVGARCDFVSCILKAIGFGPRFCSNCRAISSSEVIATSRFPSAALTEISTQEVKMGGVTQQRQNSSGRQLALLNRKKGPILFVKRTKETVPI